MPKIERLHPALDRLIAPDAKIEILAQGYDWSEGPVWVKNGGFLLFSDVPQNVIVRWKEGEGAREWLKPSGYTGHEPRGAELGSNGLVIDREGRLVICQHGIAGSREWRRRCRRRRLGSRPSRIGTKERV